MLIKRAYPAADSASANATSQVPAPATKAEVSDDLRCGAFQAVPPDTHRLGRARNTQSSCLLCKLLAFVCMACELGKVSVAMLCHTTDHKLQAR